MHRSLLWLLIPVLVACGSAPSAPQGPTAASVSTQSRDLPQGMVQCDLSGDIESFIHQEQASDKSAGDQASAQWTQMRKSGATDAYVAVYSDSSSECGRLKGAGSNPSVTTHKLVVDFAVHFKDDKAAADAYANGSIFGQSPSGFPSSQAVVGTKTGLTSNSIVVNQSIPPQSVYIALWQNGSFVMYLIAINLDPAASQKIAIAENGRVR